MVVLVLLMTFRNERFDLTSGLTKKISNEFRECVRELLSNNSTVQHFNNQAHVPAMSEIFLKHTYVNRSLLDTATNRHFWSDTQNEDNATISNEGLNTFDVAEENTFVHECINRKPSSSIQTHLLMSGLELDPDPMHSIPRRRCYPEGKRNISNASTLDCTKDSHCGKAIPCIGSVEADSFWGTHIFKMDLSDDLQNGLRSKNNKRAKHFAISRILDELCTCGEYCQLESLPLFYLWKRNAFVVLPSASWWKELERTFTVGYVYSAALLAFRNEFRQSFLCRDGHKLSFLNTLILHGPVASINFYDITVTNPFCGFHVTSGNRNSRHISPDTNEKHNHPFKESADQDKYPTQVSEDDILITEEAQKELVRDENTESLNPMSPDVLVYNSTAHNYIRWESPPTVHTDSVKSVQEIRNSSNRLDRMDLTHIAINGYLNASVGNSSNDRFFSNENSRSLKTATYLHKNYPAARYPYYENAISRRETYRGWQLAQPNPDNLCSAGFFFTGQNYDLVRCFCCGIGLKDFTQTGNPILEHGKHSSNCPFMIDHFGSCEAIEQYKQRHLRLDPEEIRQRQRQLNQQQQGRPISNYRAKHERFRSLSARLDTFTKWPSYISQRLEQLAEAGMYYTGTMVIDIQTYRLRIGSFHMQRNCRNDGESYTRTDSSKSSDVNNNAAKFMAFIVILFCALNNTHRVPKIASEWTYATGMDSLKSHQLFWNDTGHRFFHISANLTATDFAKILPRRAIQIQLYISGIEPNPGPTTPCSEDITEIRYNAQQEQLRTLQSRLDTFINQHSRFLRPTREQIAEAGFYYTGYNDECNCFACGCDLSEWEPNDDPWIEHCRYSDDCPYVWEVRGAAFVNLYRRRPEPTAAETATNHPAFNRAIGGLSINQDTDAHGVFNRVPESHYQNVHRAQRERRNTASQEPFRTFQSRLDSLTNWHSRFMRPTKEQIAEAGFYYTGSDDQFCCFACNVVFKNWVPSVGPWVEHCRYSPACPYAREVKGDEFINCIQHVIDQTAIERASNQHDNRNDNASLIDDYVQASLENPNLVYPMLF
ncbi:uncharacterized protein LOC127849536 isoform X1 [Dreissena polymorpha]|nr:uncharacterized protein LOC127849536 isoform X1 [Dreissena polymorpha]